MKILEELHLRIFCEPVNFPTSGRLQDRRLRSNAHFHLPPQAGASGTVLGCACRFFFVCFRCFVRFIQFIAIVTCYNTILTFLDHIFCSDNDFRRIVFEFGRISCGRDCGTRQAKVTKYRGRWDVWPWHVVRSARCRRRKKCALESVEQRGATWSNVPRFAEMREATSADATRCNQQYSQRMIGM